MALALRLLEHNTLTVIEMRTTNGANIGAGTHHLRGPTAAEQVVDQDGHVADGGAAILVAVSQGC